MASSYSAHMTLLVTCVPADRTDPAIQKLPAPIRTLIERVQVTASYTQGTCEVCRRAVSIGPVQRHRAELHTDNARIQCYLCLDPTELQRIIAVTTRPSGG